MGKFVDDLYMNDTDIRREINKSIGKVNGYYMASMYNLMEKYYLCNVLMKAVYGKEGKSETL